MRTSFLKSALIIVSGALTLLPPAYGSEKDDNLPRVEIKKFRFRRHNKKNFERLVIEFNEKDADRLPHITTVPAVNGKEASIQIERVSLVGAIPEALINDSYVSRSKFLGPVSISTDGPVKGFVIRTFLKEPVGVDAFWLAKPGRLVLDVFPSTSARTQGRVPESEFREIARIRPPQEIAPQKTEDPNQIVCYPINAAVSATVMFHAKANSGPGQADHLPLGFGGTAQTPEPVICFLASSQVVASVAFKPKSFDPNSYTQWEPFRGGMGGGMGMGFGGMSQSPLLSAPPPPPPPGNTAPLVAPPVGGGSSAAPPPGGPQGSGKVVVTDVQPGRTPLGWPLTPPSQVQRLPAAASPPKLPSFGDLPPASANPGAPATNAPAANSLLPPVK